MSDDDKIIANRKDAFKGGYDLIKDWKPARLSIVISGKTVIWSKMLIQRMVTSMSEKHQIVETFDRPIIYFFGPHPIRAKLSCVIINDFDSSPGNNNPRDNDVKYSENNWKTDFFLKYNFMRGSNSAVNSAVMNLSIDNVIYNAEILAMNMVQMSDHPYVMQGDVDLYVHDILNPDLPQGNILLGKLSQPVEFDLSKLKVTDFSAVPSKKKTKSPGFKPKSRIKGLTAEDEREKLAAAKRKADAAAQNIMEQTNGQNIDDKKLI